MDRPVRRALTARCESQISLSRADECGVYERFTPEAVAAVVAAHAQAVALGHEHVTTSHLVAAVAGLQDHPAADVLKRHGAAQPQLVWALEAVGIGLEPRGVSWADEWETTVARAEAVAGAGRVRVEDLLVAALGPARTHAAPVLIALGVDRGVVLAALT